MSLRSRRESTRSNVVALAARIDAVECRVDARGAEHRAEVAPPMIAR